MVTNNYSICTPLTGNRLLNHLCRRRIQFLIDAEKVSAQVGSSPLLLLLLLPVWLIRQSGCLRQWRRSHLDDICRRVQQQQQQRQQHRQKMNRETNVANSLFFLQQVEAFNSLLPQEDPTSAAAASENHKRLNPKWGTKQSKAKPS